MMHFAHPILLLVGLLLLLPLIVRRRHAWQYSSLALLSTRLHMGLGMWLTTAMSLCALLLILMALARPQRSLAHTERDIVARDIILTLDLSLSMEGHILAQDNSKRTQRKLDVMQQAAVAFVQRHTHDRLGLIVFGDQAFGAWPLSTDSKTLLKRLEHLGDLLPAELRGTHVENALEASLQHMQDLAASQTKIIVMLTDGLDTINPKAEERLVQHLKNQGIKLYVLGIQLPDKSSLIQLTHKAQGKYYPIDHANAVMTAIQDIEHHEPSRLQVQQAMEHQELYVFFLIPGLMLWLASGVCKSIWLLEV